MAYESSRYVKNISHSPIVPHHIHTACVQVIWDDAADCHHWMPTYYNSLCGYVKIGRHYRPRSVGTKDLGHLWLANIRIMLKAGTLVFWCSLIQLYTFVVMQCKDVGSDSTYLRQALSMGTLVWKVSQILWLIISSCSKCARRHWLVIISLALSCWLWKFWIWTFNLHMHAVHISFIFVCSYMIMLYWWA